MLQFDEYKVKLNNLAPTLEKLGAALNLDAAEQELDMLQAESASDGFWNNLDKAQKVQQRIKVLQSKVDSQKKRQQQWDDLMALCEMGNEFEDESLIPELEEGFAELEKNMEGYQGAVRAVQKAKETAKGVQELIATALKFIG